MIGISVVPPSGITEATRSTPDARHTRLVPVGVGIVNAPVASVSAVEAPSVTEMPAAPVVALTARGHSRYSPTWRREARSPPMLPMS